MSKAPLTSTRRMRDLAFRMEMHAALGRSYLHLCAMHVEFEALCSRYTGPTTDLDPFVERAKEAVGKGTGDWMQAVLDRIMAELPELRQQPSDAP